MKSQNNESVILSLIESGVFYIDNNCQIWRLKGGKGFKQENSRKRKEGISAERLLPNGYLQVRTLINGKRYHCYSHRIIWKYFNGDIINNLQINHKDGNKANNFLSNLELLTSSENKKHAAKYLTCWNGEKNGNAKLKSIDIIKIRKLALIGITSKILSKKFNISISQINDIKAKRAWKHLI